MSGDRLATIAFCWRLERRDGVMVALTGHDRDLVVDGVTYRAAPGLTPSAIVRAEGLDADTMEASGALGATAISARDLAAGRWDGARVVAFAVDWSDPAQPPVPLGEGRIGAVTLDGERFAAELTGAAAALDRPVAEATSPGCRATLGDRRCRVAMAERRHLARVVSQEARAVTIDAGGWPADTFGDGRLRWLGGENAGLETGVAASDGGVLMLREPPPFAVQPGTLVEAVEGCDRTIATCAARFGNAANFRGEPYLPGIDLLTRYPGA